MGGLQLAFEAHDQHATLTTLAFAPDGSMLATGGHQGVVDLYRVGAEDGGAWQRVARCAGHSSTILHMDWGYSAGALGATKARARRRARTARRPGHR